MGLSLEYEISTILKNHGWSTINNRYYVDDRSNVVREIDIVAYKSKSFGETLFYTALLISCKKSEHNNWAFLTKDYDFKDPNIKFYPT